MEKYPKLTYKISRFSDFSSDELEAVVKSIERDYGADILNYWVDEQMVTEIVSAKIPSEKRKITIYWVREALRELHLRCFEKQFG
jgi:hypothetical protein